MRIFLGAEIEDRAGDLLYKIRKNVEKKLQFICEENAGLEKDVTYGMEFQDVGIITIIIPEEMKEYWKERKYISRKKNSADIRLYMDYERFIKETPKNQRLMYIENIIKSIEVLKERSKGDFKGDKLIQDILDALNVTMEDLERLNKKKSVFSKIFDKK